MKSTLTHTIKFKTTFPLLILLLLINSSARAQLLDSLTLDTLTAFTSMEEALKNPEKVIKLVLRRDKFKEFPNDIFKFTNLQYLDLSKNNIKVIPHQIGTLKDLQYFAISKNGLIEFPSEIGDLTNLYYLNGNQNDLTSLPPEIGKLKNLKNLDLWDNNLDTFPEEITNCKKLKIVDLRAIMISDSNQAQIKSLLKHTKIYFSPYCNCEQ